MWKAIYRVGEKNAWEKKIANNTSVYTIHKKVPTTYLIQGFNQRA